MRISLGFGSLLLALLTASCTNATGLSTCDPACLAGTHCDDTGVCAPDSVVADMARPDLAVPMSPDLSMDCVPGCVAPTAHCNAATHHCVGCLGDNDCPVGQVCTITAATAYCAPGCKDDSRCNDPGSDGGAGSMKCCGGQCADTGKDGTNCGACGTNCTSQNGVSMCVAGTCKAGACRAGWGDCNMNPADGCETSLRTDVKNCQACGKVCAIANSVPGCDEMGCYISACKFGYDDCNSDSGDGCEASVLADTKNCGQCGHDCNAPAIAHGKAGCSLALCQLSTCDQGWADCNGVEKDGCEVATTNDSNNCGGCGVKCAQGLICKGSQCTCPNCNYANASAVCVNFVCTFGKCDPGFGDCDNNIKNGCEQDLTKDPNNCGACGNVCPKNTPYCSASACTAKLPGLLLGTINGQEYYKVDVMGAMTDTNIWAACIGAGFQVPCQAQNGCNYNDKLCVPTQENSCGNPMQGLSKVICNGANPSACPALYGCYQYMGHTWQQDSGCGAEQGQWCSVGKNVNNKFAICTP